MICTNCGKTSATGSSTCMWCNADLEPADTDSDQDLYTVIITIRDLPDHQVYTSIQLVPEPRVTAVGSPAMMFGRAVYVSLLRSIESSQEAESDER